MFRKSFQLTLGLAKWNSPLYNSIWVKVTCAQKKVHFSGTKSQCQYVHYQNIIITSPGLIMHNRMSLTPPQRFVMQGLTHNVFLLPGLRDWHQWATMWVDGKDLSLVLEVKRGGMRNWLVPYEPSSEGCTNRGKCYVCSLYHNIMRPGHMFNCKRVQAATKDSTIASSISC